MSRFGRLIAGAVALFAALAFGGRDVVARPGTTDRDPVSVLVVAGVSGGFDQSLADALADSLCVHLASRVDAARFSTPQDIRAVLTNAQFQLLVGNAADLGSIETNLGPPFILGLLFATASSGSRSLTGSLVSMRTGAIVRRVQRALPDDDALALLQMGAVATSMATNLGCDLQGVRLRPAVPVVLLEVTPGEVGPGETVHVQVTLRDSSDGEAQAGRNFTLKLSPPDGGAAESEDVHRTDALGRWSGDVPVGDAAGHGKFVASFRGADGAVTNSSDAHFNVRGTTGDVTISAPEAALELGAGETVTARRTHDGAPVAGASLAFAAVGGGGVAAASVVTDANGYASTEYQAPTSNAVVDVTVTAPALAAKGPKAAASGLSASLTFVVDGGVTLNLDAPDTDAESTSDVTADLLVGGTAIPGTDVIFALSGGGALSADTAPTNDAGRAEVTWLAPIGTSTATITAEAIVDGQRYSQTVTVHGRPGGPMRVKVLPRFRDDVNFRTLADVGSADPMRTCSFAVANLSGVYNCNDGPGTYGSPAAYPPVTLRAELDGQYFAEVKVTQPEPKVVVVDAAMSGPGDDGACDNWACLELEFRSAGVLTVERDSAAITGRHAAAVLRPKQGLTFASDGELRHVISGATGWAEGEVPLPGSGTVDIAGRETLQLFVGCTGGDIQHPMPTGRVRFTLTFRPR